MHRKQKLALAIRSQFRQPRGCAGWLAGWAMALRSSNRQRNVWAVGLLGVEPTDRVLDIGFGPVIAIRELSRRATQDLVCGVDHAAVMVRQATRRNAAAGRAGRVAPRSPRAALEPEIVSEPKRPSRRARHPLVIAGNAIFTIILVVAIAGGVAYSFGKHKFDAAGPLERERIVNIPRGLGLREIADLLAR